MSTVKIHKDQTVVSFQGNSVFLLNFNTCLYFQGCFNFSLQEKKVSADVPMCSADMMPLSQVKSSAVSKLTEHTELLLMLLKACKQQFIGTWTIN